jgi:DNA-binding SARP family transcriptional activator
LTVEAAIRVLGPLDVMLDRQRVTIRSGRRRAVLVALMLRPNEVVSSAELIDLVWGDEPPREPVSALQMQVSRLRRLLNPSAGGPDMVGTVSGGYLLRIDPDRRGDGHFRSGRGQPMVVPAYRGRPR